MEEESTMTDSSSRRSEPAIATDNLAREVIGAAMEVHRLLGLGYVEAVNEEALAVELRLRDFRFARQQPMHVIYNSHDVGEGRLDFLVGDHLVVELKSVEALLPMHKARVISYLKATGNHLGLLINFNVKLLREGIQRVVCS
jgi:GxxExxY protein